LYTHIKKEAVVANGKYECKEIRMIVGPELTHVYTHIEADQNCPMGVQGVHYKAFPPTISTTDIMLEWQNGEQDPVMWPLKAFPKVGDAHA